MEPEDSKAKTREASKRISKSLRPTLIELAQRMADAETIASIGGDVIPRINLSPENRIEVETSGERYLLDLVARILTTCALELEPDVPVMDPTVDEVLESVLRKLDRQDGVVAVVARAGLRDAREDVVLSDPRPVYEWNRLTPEQDRQLRAEIDKQGATYEEDRVSVLGKEAAHRHRRKREQKNE